MRGGNWSFGGLGGGGFVLSWKSMEIETRVLRLLESLHCPHHTYLNYSLIERDNISKSNIWWQLIVVIQLIYCLMRCPMIKHNPLPLDLWSMLELRRMRMILELDFDLELVLRMAEYPIQSDCAFDAEREKLHPKSFPSLTHTLSIFPPLHERGMRILVHSFPPLWQHWEYFKRGIK